MLFGDDSREKYRLVLDEFYRTLEEANPLLYRQLLAQNKFISNLAKVQRRARDERGKKDVKEDKLRKLLADEAVTDVRGVESVPMPLEPSVEVSPGPDTSSFHGGGRKAELKPLETPRLWLRRSVR